MKTYARPLILILSAVALAASLASLYVHYNILRDPLYASFCDVNETVSCEAVYQSPYGTAFGVPVAAGGAIWSALVLLLAAMGMRSPKAEQAATVAGYIFVLSVVGLAAVFYFGYASFFVLKKVCVLCVTMYVAVIGIFLVASSAASISLGSLPPRFARDLRGVFMSPLAASLAIAWIVGSASLIAFFPREEARAVASTEAIAAAPIETLAQDQLDQWHKWLDSQPRAEEVKPTGGVKVLVVKFNDYQCPACRQTWAEYRGIIEKYEAQYPDTFKFEYRDFPLEAECGFGGVHGAACEGAVAVRLAREKNREKEMSAWLYEHQPEMTRDTVKDALEDIAQVSGSEYDAQYAKLVADIRMDANLGQKLGVEGTPTFFINGIKVPSLRAAYFDAAIAYELMK